MKRPLRCLLVTTIVAAIPVTVAVAGTVSEDVPVPGGRAVLAAAFNIQPVPDRARFLSEAARLIHGVPERKAATPEVLAARLRLAAASGGVAELVPVPLSAALWSDAIFQRQVSRDDLVVSILGDRQASLLAHGLAGMDDETLDYLAQHPALLTQIYTLGAEPFAVFASTVQVRRETIVPPGGEEAVVLWEQIIGERVTRADRFISALFTRVDARLAGLYDTVGHLALAHQRFALGLWIADPSARLEHFQALVAAAITSPVEGRIIKTQPFARQPHDLAAALVRVRVDSVGRPVEPASRAFWSSVIDGPELPADPAKTLAAALEEDDGTLDAAWLAGLVMTSDMRLRAERLDQFAFGQRVFAGVPAAEIPDALVAARAFRRYRMLMVTLERMGIRKPATFANAARVATRLSSSDAARAFVATGQFQGALVLLWRMRQVGTLDVTTAEALVESLLAVPLNSSSQYLGGVVRWLDEQLRPKIPPAGSLDAAIEAAVSGPDESSSAPRITWEGKLYRVDLGAGEAERLHRVREKLGGATLDLALDLAASARRLSATPASPGAVQAMFADLTSVAKEHFFETDGDIAVDGDAFPPGVSLPPAPRGSVMRAIDELGRSGGSNLPRAARAASELVDAADEAAAQALVSLAYAINLGDPEGAALLPGNVSRRHDFGFNQRDSDQRLRAAWMTPRQDVSPGIPWHLDGSLLGLDVALAQSALRRLSADRALAAPTLTSNERETFVVSYGLMNPTLLTDTGRDAIAAAIERGQRRLARANADEMSTVASELHMDGWRRRALLWTGVHDRTQLESMMSLRELLALGQEGATVDLDAWGTSAMVSEGCVCTRMPAPGGLPLLTGRHQIGLLATIVPDLNLHVARMLSHLRLPARLAKYVLSAAVLDFVDEVRGTDPDDWLSLVRGAAAVPQDRIEDYVAAAAADGPLVMEPSK